NGMRRRWTTRSEDFRQYGFRHRGGVWTIEFRGHGIILHYGKSLEFSLSNTTTMRRSEGANHLAENADEWP
ncbi:hypothetical protein ACC722_39070, partial [Rhizobium ruizarguesonis]